MRTDPFLAMFNRDVGMRGHADCEQCPAKMSREYSVCSKHAARNLHPLFKRSHAQSPHCHVQVTNPKASIPLICIMSNNF